MRSQKSLFVILLTCPTWRDFSLNHSSIVSFTDLGFRVTGGKRLSNGDLGAFVTAVNRNKAYDILGEIKEGMLILEL